MYCNIKLKNYFFFNFYIFRILKVRNMNISGNKNIKRMLSLKLSARLFRSFSYKGGTPC